VFHKAIQKSSREIASLLADLARKQHPFLVAVFLWHCAKPPEAELARLLVLNLSRKKVRD